MGLFKILLSLFPGAVPQENFFTEIVAYSFQAYPDLLDAWLRYFNLADPDDYSVISISTQYRLVRPEHQSVDSIVDMTINLSHESITDTLFIESKIGSKEGKGQLQRYATHLAELPGRRNRTLLYITRDDEHPHLENIGQKVQFRHQHWYEFYRFLQQQPYNPLIQELIVFMKELEGEGKRLGLDSQITGEAVLAKSPIPREVMDRTLLGKVKQRFEQVLGPTHKPPQSMLAEWGTYALYAELGQNELRCWLGYRIDIAGNHPTNLQLMLQATPGARYRHAIIRAMKSICSKPGWHPDDLDQHTWSGIFCEREIPKNLFAQDLVGNIEAQFMDLINELAEIKTQYTHLPWEPK